MAAQLCSLTLYSCCSGAWCGFVINCDYPLVLDVVVQNFVQPITILLAFLLHTLVPFYCAVGVQRVALRCCSTAAVPAAQQLLWLV